MNTTLTILIVCAAVGITNTLYLTWHSFTKTDVACIGFPKAWCRKVQYARQSRMFGIPNSVLGFLMYSAILLFVVLQPDFPYWPVKALVAFGFAFSLYFTYVQAFILRAFCTWCVISSLDFFVMFWAVFLR
ncbi:MAG TPA: vitamin K epoxide reductase family protein [Candidatus Paceibacterota bacterium]|nr:vitamin K epoxide reductase family protein [Candidatus Paceibacterota bacterium]